MNDTGQVLASLLAVAVVAVLAPLLVGLLPRLRVPQVVLLLLGGMIVGPQLLAVARPGDIQPLSDIGLGFVFLLAGYEIDQRLYRSDAGRRAVLSWVLTAVLAVGVVGALAAFGLVRAFLPVAIALTTTAFGTLVPILREGGLLEGRLGGFLAAAGAVGELLPIIAIALLLGVNNRFVALISLGAIAGLSVLLGAAPRLVRAGGRLARVIAEGQHETAQVTLRITVLLLVLLLTVAQEFRLDAVLGAFAAGMVLRRWAGAPELESKLDVIGYGFFIPVFFVYSGMTVDLHAIVSAPLRLLLFFGLLV